jgi:hypothetical protein
MDLDSEGKDSSTLPRLTSKSLCQMLTFASKESISLYDKEGQMVSLAYSRLQEVLKIVMEVEEQVAKSSKYVLRKGIKNHKHSYTDDIFALRKVSASINEVVTKLAGRMSLIAGGEESSLSLSSFANMFVKNDEVENSSRPGAIYVRILLLGKKPSRFKESTSIPTFLDWGSACICRVPRNAVSESLKNAFGRGEELQKSLEREICRTFSEPLTSALKEEMDCKLLELLTEVPLNTGSLENSEKSYLVVTPTIVKEVNRNNEIQSKRFQIKRRNPGPQNTEIVTSITVAKHFPCAISRQPTLVTTEFTASGSFF